MRYSPSAQCLIELKNVDSRGVRIKGNDDMLKIEQNFIDLTKMDMLN